MWWSYRDPGRFLGKGWIKLEFDRLILPNADVPISGKGNLHLWVHCRRRRQNSGTRSFRAGFARLDFSTSLSSPSPLFSWPKKRAATSRAKFFDYRTHNSSSACWPMHHFCVCMALLATNDPPQPEGSLFPRLAHGSEEPTVIHKTNAGRGTNPTAVEAGRLEPPLPGGTH